MATDLKAVSTNNPEVAAKYMSEADEAQKSMYASNLSSSVTTFYSELTEQSGAPWSCDELYQLVRLSTEKFPPGI